MRHSVFLGAVVLILGGCVSAGKYKSAVEETQALQSKVTAYESELSALRASCSAKAQESAAKIEGVQKQAKDLGEQVAALEKSQVDLEKERKDLRKVGDLLKADNERLEKAVADRKAEYAKAVAKLKAVVDEMGALEEGGKPAR